MKEGESHEELDLSPTNTYLHFMMGPWPRIGQG